MDEGLCIQIMHLGRFDDEGTTIALMDAYLEQNGYLNDMSAERLHHEIYLSDARKVAPEKWVEMLRLNTMAVNRESASVLRNNEGCL